MSTAPFGVGGRPRKPHTCIEDVPRVCIWNFKKGITSPGTALARETSITVRIGGQAEEQRIGIAWVARYGRGMQAFFVCGDCGRKVWHLYLQDTATQDTVTRLTCGRCAGAGYMSKHIKNRLPLRAAKLRRRLGALPGLLSPLPRRPRHNRAGARYDRIVHELTVVESKIAAQVHAMVPRVRRRLKP